MSPTIRLPVTRSSPPYPLHFYPHSLDSTAMQPITPRMHITDLRATHRTNIPKDRLSDSKTSLLISLERKTRFNKLNSIRSFIIFSSVIYVRGPVRYYILVLMNSALTIPPSLYTLHFDESVCDLHRVLFDCRAALYGEHD